MPTGLEELGPGALRDVFAYLCAGHGGFRLFDVQAFLSLLGGERPYIRSGELRGRWGGGRRMLGQGRRGAS